MIPGLSKPRGGLHRWRGEAWALSLSFYSQFDENESSLGGEYQWLCPEGRQASAERCYSFNARGIVRDGEASVPVLTASLGFRQCSAAAWCLQTQCILEKLFPVVFVHLQRDDCTIQHSLLYWGGGGGGVMGCHYLCGKLGVLFETASPLPMSSYVLSWLNINVFPFIPATEAAGIEPRFSWWLRLLRLSDATCEISVVQGSKVARVGQMLLLQHVLMHVPFWEFSSQGLFFFFH